MVNIWGFKQQQWWTFGDWTCGFYAVNQRRVTSKNEVKHKNIECIKIAGWWLGCHFFDFPISWEFHHPNWLSYFSEGWPNHQPDRIETDGISGYGLSKDEGVRKIPLLRVKKNHFTHLEQTQIISMKKSLILKDFVCFSRRISRKKVGHLWKLTAYSPQKREFYRGHNPVRKCLRTWCHL